MARSFCIPGIIILALALACGILASLSLPFLPAIEVVRTHFNGNAAPPGGSTAVPSSEIRLGIWAFCTYALNGARTCSPRGHGYSFTVNGANNISKTIGSSWTRGLAITPVATAVTFIAFLLSFSEHITVTLVASLVSFLAAFLMLLAFIIDIALFAFVHREMGGLGLSESTNTGAGFWLTFAALILLIIAGFTVCFGRRRHMRDNSYPTTSRRSGFLSRFRRRRA